MTTEDFEPYLEFEIDQGCSYSHIIQLFDLLELALDITGCSARMQFRSTVQSSNVLLEASTTNSKLVLGTTDGNVMMSLLPADTATFKSDCVFDCHLTFPTGEIVKAFVGKVSLNPAVTR
jgi:hypothetical protein